MKARKEAGATWFRGLLIEFCNIHSTSSVIKDISGNN